MSAFFQPSFAETGFTQKSYQLCSDIVYSYRMNQMAAYEGIQHSLDLLKQEDEKLGNVWQELMDYWIYTNTDITIHPDVLPDGLPQDDSLCIVVLGYQLLPDGAMSDELIGRCTIAQKCAIKYPNAIIAVTGGGTASNNKSATEADRMRSWLVEHGISSERIVVENRSQTTAENAVYTCTRLHEEYPQVKELAIVSSDYHVPLGCLMFRAQELLYSYEEETYAMRIIANAGYMTGITEPAESIAQQGADIWSIASILE